MQMKEPEEFWMTSEERLDHAKCVFLFKRKREKKAFTVTAKNIHTRQNKHSEEQLRLGREHNEQQSFRETLS